MELRQLRYFVRIVDLGSVSRAAADLYVAQPALSKQVAALEAELKTPLLVRSTRGVTPTDAGLAFYAQAQSILRQLGRVPDEVRSAAGQPAGMVAVGMPFSASCVVAPALVAAARTAFPQVKLAITQGVSGHLEELLSSGRLNLSLLYERVQPSRHIEERALLSEDLYLVTREEEKAGRPRNEGQRDDKPKEDSVPLREVARHPLLLPGPANATRRLIDQALAREGLRLDLLAEVDSPWSIKYMVKQGMGAAIVSRSALFPESEATDLRVRRIVRPALTRGLCLCTLRNEALGRATTLVHELLEQVVRDLVRRGEWRGATLAGKR